MAPSSLEIKKIRQEEGAAGDAVNGMDAVNGQAKVNGNGETTVCDESVLPPAEVLVSLPVFSFKYFLYLKCCKDTADQIVIIEY